MASAARSPSGLRTVTVRYKAPPAAIGLAACRLLLCESGNPARISIPKLFFFRI
jgi:hypothetical protein